MTDWEWESLNYDIAPGPSFLVEEGRVPKGRGWQRLVYTDEVFWKYLIDDEYLSYHNVVRWPFVPGFFLAKVLDDNWGEVHYPVAGPFPNLKAAKAAAILLGVCKEHSD